MWVSAATGMEQYFPTCISWNPALPFSSSWEVLPQWAGLCQTMPPCMPWDSLTVWHTEERGTKFPSQDNGVAELKIGAVSREGRYLLKHFKITCRNTLCSGSECHFHFGCCDGSYSWKNSEFLSCQRTDFCSFLLGSLVPMCPVESLKFVLKPTRRVTGGLWA